MPRRTVKNPQRKDKAVDRLQALADTAKEAEQAAVNARHKMYRFLPKAFEAGMTYDEMAETIGRTKIRVSQILAEMRENGQAPEETKTAIRKASPKKKATARKKTAKKKPAARKRAAKK